MSESNAYELRFTEIDLEGEKCLFTESRVRAATIPPPLLRYEVRYADEHDEAYIKAKVDDCFLGTVIAQHPFLLNSQDVLLLKEGEVDFYTGPETSISAFANKYGIELKPQSGKSTRSIGHVEFADEFAGDNNYGYHLSFDGLRLMKDGEDAIWEKRLQTDQFVHYAHEDEDVMFTVTSEGAIDKLVADNYFADEGLLDSLEAIVTRTGGVRAVFMDEFTRPYLPEMARDFEWCAPGKDAMKITYYNVETQGTRALYTEDTVSPESVPKALHIYEIDSDPANPDGKQRLSKHTYVNFTGTLITERPLDLGEHGYIYMDAKDVSLHSDAPIKLKDFAREVGVRIKSPEGRER